MGIKAMLRIAYSNQKFKLIWFQSFLGNGTSKIISFTETFASLILTSYFQIKMNLKSFEELSIVFGSMTVSRQLS